MSVHKIMGASRVSLDPDLRERSPRRKMTDPLQGIAEELSLFLRDISLWIEEYPLASIMELNLEKAVQKLKKLSIRLQATLEDLRHYLEVIPENSDNDLAEEMLQMVTDDLQSITNLTLCTYEDDAHFNFGYVLEKAETLSEKKLTPMLFHLFQELHERAWQEAKKLFQETMRKCI